MEVAAAEIVVNVSLIVPVRNKTVHKNVSFCFHLVHAPFKSGSYYMGVKVSGSREPLPSKRNLQVSLCNPLFYLSSFLSLLGKSPAAFAAGLFQSVKRTFFSFLCACFPVPPAAPGRTYAAHRCAKNPTAPMHPR